MGDKIVYIPGRGPIGDRIPAKVIAEDGDYYWVRWSDSKWGYHNENEIIKKSLCKDSY